MKVVIFLRESSSKSVNGSLTSGQPFSSYRAYKQTHKQSPEVINILTKSLDFVSKNYNSRTEEATNVKLHHVIQEGDG